MQQLPDILIRLWINTLCPTAMHCGLYMLQAHHVHMQSYLHAFGGCHPKTVKQKF